MPITEEPERQEHYEKYTLYFLRHGEALHNVEEKKAQLLAQRQGMAQGLSEEFIKLKMEQARMAILNNDELQDCPLTDKGKDEALQARERIRELIETSGMPPIEEVLVSPLQRALQTADIVFPDFANIHVREELKERQTLKACDTRVSSSVMSSRPEFMRFSMHRLRLASLQAEDLPNLDELFREYSSREHFSLVQEDAVEEGDLSESQQEKFQIKCDQVEEKYMLRERTKKLFPLLQESKHRVICVVAHKGYLRELERGPFQQEDATEFQNCEVRVYRVQLLGAELKSAERIV